MKRDTPSSSPAPKMEPGLIFPETLPKLDNTEMGSGLINQEIFPGKLTLTPF
jgi:hypothetical protein